MTELLTVHTPPDAWQRFLQHFQPTVRTERIATADALDRVLAETLLSPQDLPDFERSTVDGYAVNAADTYGATPTLPAFLTVAGEVPMGLMAWHAAMHDDDLLHLAQLMEPLLSIIPERSGAH